MTREQIFQQLSEQPEQNFDLVIIGGGASGAGLALEASHVGLKVLLLEANDFMSGTSSRSTKLLHGGVRYLEQAIKTLDWQKYQLVKDALQERKQLMSMAPHLCRPLTLVTPCKNPFEQAYYYLGLQFYQWLAGKQKLGRVSRLSRATLQACQPNLGAQYRSAVSYVDGQFDDARFGISMLQTAQQLGAQLLNYCPVTKLHLRDGQVVGLSFRDELKHTEWQIQCSQIINATGAFCDQIRQLADPELPPLVSSSRGSHLVLPRKFLPTDQGLLIPNTSDGRVLFMLPWQDYCLLGTTDNESQASLEPQIPEQDIQYLLAEIRPHLKQRISKQDILGCFTGFRPLIQGLAGQGSSKISRDHQIHQDSNGLISLIGGKWTTWRIMAQDCLAFAKQKFSLNLQQPSQHYSLVGAQLGVPLQLAADLEPSIAQHLLSQYGDQAQQVMDLGPVEPILAGHPYITNELIWAYEQEFCHKIDDLIERRWRIGQQNAKLAAQLKDRISALQLWPTGRR